MNKKGFVISFSWLFSIIAGISIFLFLVWFSVQQTDLFGNLTAKIAVEELDIAFTGFKSNLIRSDLEFGKPIKLEFRCDENTLYDERMFINGKAGKKLKGNLIFAPSLMNSDKFKFFTDGWNIPFRVTNFIFLNSPENRLDLPDALPDGLDIPDGFDTNDGVVVEFRSTSFSESDCVDDKKIIFYEEDGVTGEYSGRFCFYDTISNDYVIKDFYGNAMIYAYIFSDNDNFQCLYEIANKKAEGIKKFYLEKLEEIHCNDVNKRDAEDDLGVNILNPPNKNKINNIAETNERLLRAGCEGIY